MDADHAPERVGQATDTDRHAPDGTPAVDTVHAGTPDAQTADRQAVDAANHGAVDGRATEVEATTDKASTDKATPDKDTADEATTIKATSAVTPDGATPAVTPDGATPAVTPDGATPAVTTDGAAPADPPADRAADELPAIAEATAPVMARDAITAPVGAEPSSAEALVADQEQSKRPHEEVPWRIIWSAIGVVLGAVAAIELVLALRTVIELLVISTFFAVVLSPAVSGLVRLKIRRGLATAIVFFLGMATFGGLGYLFIHPLYQQAIHFANDLPGTLARVQDGKGRIGSIIARYHLQKDAATYIPKIRDYLSHLGGPALGIARTVLSGLGGLVLLSIMTFLMLLEGPSIVNAALRILSPQHARRVRRILDDVAKSVTGYVIGNFTTSVIAGVVCTVALLVLGVPFALVFGVWVALVDFIPLVGGLLAGVPTVAFAFLHSPLAGIVTLIVFLVYQQLENHVLNPLIMSKTVNLGALWVLLSVLAGAELAGFVGALLAIPAAGTIHVIARDIWDERRGRLKTTPTVGPDQDPLP
jgi:predicted PurR-regulated permease PerM